MSYSVQHVRFTLECDVCGLVEKRNTDAGDNAAVSIYNGYAFSGWSNIMTTVREYFCCPGCREKVLAVLDRREREQQAAQAEIEKNCEHDYQVEFLRDRCTKCRGYR